MRRWIAAKVHGVRVTDKSVRYVGSVTLCSGLMRAADMEPYEAVDVVNLSNGQRWTTYLLPGQPGVFTLNGGGARLGEVGDECVLMTFRSGERFQGAPVVMVGPGNVAARNLFYRPPDPSRAAVAAGHVENLT
jgi:aspartate 1-decarboxylase